MSYFDYAKSLEISAEGPPFASLIMAALRKADSTNYWLLESAFPAITDELRRRYNAPGGYLEGETHADEE